MEAAPAEEEEEEKAAAARGWHGKTQHAQQFRNRRFAWRDRVCARGAE